MNKQDFRILIAGLKEKVYHFKYELDDSFFNTVEQPLIEQSSIVVDLSFDKTHEPYVLHFKVTGTFEGECDRCASTINIPINADYRLFVELGNIENDDETEVIYISREDHDIKLYDHIYDFVNLSIPMVKRCTSIADVKLCDEKVSSFMERINSSSEKTTDPRWEALKKLKK